MLQFQKYLFNTVIQAVKRIIKRLAKIMVQY